MTQKLFSLILISFFLFACSSTETNKEGESIEKNPNWTEHIAPIVFKNCTPCHRPGESGAFNLLSYSDAVKKAKLIKFVTQTGYMPPWPADWTWFVNVLAKTRSQPFRPRRSTRKPG